MAISKELTRGIAEALVIHAKGHIAKYEAEVSILLGNPVGVGSHDDLLNTIMDNLEQIGRYEEHIRIIEERFCGDAEA